MISVREKGEERLGVRSIKTLSGSLCSRRFGELVKSHNGMTVVDGISTPYPGPTEAMTCTIGLPSPKPDCNEQMSLTLICEAVQ